MWAAPALPHQEAFVSVVTNTDEAAPILLYETMGTLDLQVWASRANLSQWTLVTSTGPPRITPYPRHFAWATPGRLASLVYLEATHTAEVYTLDLTLHEPSWILDSSATNVTAPWGLSALGGGWLLFITREGGFIKAPQARLWERRVASPFPNFDEDLYRALMLAHPIAMTHYNDGRLLVLNGWAGQQMALTNGTQWVATPLGHRLLEVHCADEGYCATSLVCDGIQPDDLVHCLTTDTGARYGRPRPMTLGPGRLLLWGLRVGILSESLFYRSDPPVIWSPHQNDLSYEDCHVPYRGDLTMSVVGYVVFGLSCLLVAVVSVSTLVACTRRRRAAARAAKQGTSIPLPQTATATATSPASAGSPGPEDGPATGGPGLAGPGVGAARGRPITGVPSPASAVQQQPGVPFTYPLFAWVLRHMIMVTATGAVFYQVRRAGWLAVVVGGESETDPPRGVGGFRSPVFISPHPSIHSPALPDPPSSRLSAGVGAAPQLLYWLSLPAHVQPMTSLAWAVRVPMYLWFPRDTDRYNRLYAALSIVYQCFVGLDVAWGSLSLMTRKCLAWAVERSAPAPPPPRDEDEEELEAGDGAALPAGREGGRRKSGAAPAARPVVSFQPNPADLRLMARFSRLKNFWQHALLALPLILAWGAWMASQALLYGIAMLRPHVRPVVLSLIKTVAMLAISSALKKFTALSVGWLLFRGSLIHTRFVQMVDMVSSALMMSGLQVYRGQPNIEAEVRELLLWSLTQIGTTVGCMEGLLWLGEAAHVLLVRWSWVQPHGGRPAAQVALLDRGAAAGEEEEGRRPATSRRAGCGHGCGELGLWCAGLRGPFRGLRRWGAAWWAEAGRLGVRLCLLAVARTDPSPSDDWKPLVFLFSVLPFYLLNAPAIGLALPLVAALVAASFRLRGLCFARVGGPPAAHHRNSHVFQGLIFTSVLPLTYLAAASLSSAFLNYWRPYNPSDNLEVLEGLIYLTVLYGTLSVSIYLFFLMDRILRRRVVAAYGEGADYLLYCRAYEKFVVLSHEAEGAAPGDDDDFPAPSPNPGAAAGSPREVEASWAAGGATATVAGESLGPKWSPPPGPEPLGPPAGAPWGYRPPSPTVTMLVERHPPDQHHQHHQHHQQQPIPGAEGEPPAPPPMAPAASPL
ncbi:hypothetical protein PAPYR_3108 [Paratrimastix pyriformis]|uniref:Uncharacterized protein n=1 Tax=Paratrimastix pyriformis TaxID=342808 RepID=A0ABQ8UMT5_9EUKA|nr:hypothetical protein PAPYR_3108 [Paratrimastix pyriformis]